jgi:hypothetical protein
MRAAIFNGPMDITVGDRPDPPRNRRTLSSASSWHASVGPTSGTTEATLHTRSARSGTSSSGWWSRPVSTSTT